MKSINVQYPGSEKVYIPGEINRIRVGMRKISLSNTTATNEDGTEYIKYNNPVILYDTSGPYSNPQTFIDITAGLPRTRQELYRKKDIEPLTEYSSPYAAERARQTTIGELRFPVAHMPVKAKEKKNLTQMYYAKRRIITPEMEYVAIRENQQVEALGLKSYITPEFVRKEIASGRAIIPANINHPEVEPMIIGRKFLVKINTTLCHTDRVPNIEEEVEKMIWGCKWGTDAFTVVTKGPYHHEMLEWILRCSPIPIATVPLYQALERAGDVENLSWEIFKDTLIEQAEQGVDVFILHAAFLQDHLEMSRARLSGIVSNGGAILSQWMKIHDRENFLYTHFDDICEIARTYDVTLSIAEALRPGSIYDANDSAQFAELAIKSQMVKRAWSFFTQIIIEGPGHATLNNIQPNIKEMHYSCDNAPYYTYCPLTTDIAPGYDYITGAIGGAKAAWHGASLIYSDNRIDFTGNIGKTEIRNSIIAFKIAAHSADLAKGHPGSQVRDNAISKARYESRIKDLIHLSIDPEKTVYQYM